MIKKLLTFLGLTGLIIGGAVGADLLFTPAEVEKEILVVPLTPTITALDAGLTTGTLISLEAPLFSEAELDIIKVEKKLAPVEDYIYRNTINNKLLIIDETKTSREDLVEYYINLFYKLGDTPEKLRDDFFTNGKTINADERIKQLSKGIKVVVPVLIK